ncbi:hypothetical protein [Pontimicrobium sp. MEBiC06410]
MKTKLKDITTQYRKFSTNQVLTEHQLNEFLDYFDDQDRLTRTSLSGVGIACGFKLTYIETENAIEITQGRGVTTDGDLVALQNPSTTEEGVKDKTLKSINLSKKTYKFYKKFTDANVKYKHFLNPDNEQIDLWELAETGDESYTALEALDNIKNMVVLLYVENYSKEGELCTQLSCDNQGIEQVSKLKVLLVTLENARYIIGQDAIYNKHNWNETFVALPEVSAKRIILNTKNTATFTTLKQNYFNAIKQNNTIPNLKTGLKTILSRFNRASLDTRIDSLFNFSSNGTPTDYQYRYDVLKDLIDTYNEIKDLLLHINVACCPNIGAFPKHLMIGRIEEVKPFLTFRHQFYKSPVIGHEDANYKKVISLINRITALATSYIDFNKGDAIKITPSQASGQLGNKAIPFYYDVDNTLLKDWSFEKLSNLRSHYNLSYKRGNLAQTPSVQEPLSYNIDNYNFYRIEGHQGKLYKDALDQILRKKEDNGLNFDVKVLSINATTQTINLNDYKCQFEDLSILLNAWRTEQNCILSEMSRFFSAFSTTEVGTNVVAVNNGFEFEIAPQGPTVITDGGAAGGVTTGGTVVLTNDDISPTSGTFRTVGNSVTNEMLSGNSSQLEQFTQQTDLVKTNIVKEQLTVEENTLGILLENAIKLNEEGSANDILATFNASAAEIKDLPEWEAEAPLADFIFTNVTETLVYSYILDDRIPDRITQIDKFTLTNYKLTIDQLCKRVKDLQAKYQTTKIKEGSKQILGLIINQLSTVCCSGKKLEILLEEIEKRKQEILAQIQLSEFVKKHPGLEHKAGVREGGTFVMAYLTENAADKPTYETVSLELDFLEQPNIDDEGLDGDEGKIKLWDNRLSTNFAFLHKVIDDTQNPLSEIVFIGKTIEETVNNLAIFLNNIWERAGERSIKAIADRKKLIIRITDRILQKEENYIHFANPAIVGTNTKIYFEENTVLQANIAAKNTVIADFALPYMCCSDCSPINFIVPKDPISLSLPQTFICLKNGVDLTPLPFKASPANADIKAKVPEGIASGVTTNELGEPVFDPALTDASLHGTEIAFTVNGEETSAKITVYADPNISVNTPQVVYNNAKTIATVTYTVVNAIPNLTYTWDFGKGELSNEIPNSDGEIVITYNLPVNTENSITPTLTISNGFCENNIAIETIIFDDPIDVALTIDETYCLDISNSEIIKIPFTGKNPVDAPIEIANGNFQGVEVQGDELIIIPNDFNTDNFGKIIKFSVLGLPTNATITINQLLAVNISKAQGVFFWANGNLFRSYGAAPVGLSDQLTYQWKINNKIVSTKQGLKFNLPIDKGENVFTVELQVTNIGGCITTVQITETVNYPDFAITLPENQVEFCLNDDNPYAITTLPTAINNTVPEGPGVVLQPLGNYVFIPSATQLTSAGIINLGINGDNLLAVTLKEASTANFTANIEENNEGTFLILKNTSELADSYVWKIGGQVIKRTTRSQVKLDVNAFETNSIDISLTAISTCGSNTKTIKSFKVKDGLDCISSTTMAIQNDHETLTIPSNFDAAIKKNVLMPIVEYYTTVNTPEIQAFLNGNKNPEIINGQFTNLLELGTAALLQLKEGPEFIITSKFYSAQIKLLFNVLHCQPEQVLIDQQDSILAIMDKLKSSLETLKNKNIVFDTNNELRDYLTLYSKDTGVVNYLRTFIIQELLPLLDGQIAPN